MCVWMPTALEAGWAAAGTEPDPAGPVVVEQGTPARGAADAWYPRTFLLTDIVGSVSLWEHDLVAMSQAVAWHDTVIQDAVDAAGGQMLRTKGEGDSTFSVFEQPAGALAAAADVQEAVNRGAGAAVMGGGGGGGGSCAASSGPKRYGSWFALTTREWPLRSGSGSAICRSRVRASLVVPRTSTVSLN